MKTTTNGRIASLNERERCLFHSFDTESISEAMRRTIKHNTAAILTADTPVMVNALIAGVGLRADVAVSEIVLIIDDSV
jgi:hypothetical protein